MKDDIVFVLFKDETLHGKNEFKKSVKKYGSQINIDNVYLRIINYQVDKYGQTLSDAGSLNYFAEQKMSGNSSRRRKLNEHKKGCKYDG